MMSLFLPVFRASSNIVAPNMYDKISGERDKQSVPMSRPKSSSQQFDTNSPLGPKLVRTISVNSPTAWIFLITASSIPDMVYTVSPGIQINKCHKTPGDGE